MLEYKIEEKEQFTVIGKRRRFCTDNSYEKIPEFWQEHMQSGDTTVCGMFGICMDADGKEFDYYIADSYVPGADVPKGYELKVIPAGTWAVFPCHGALPKALQDVNTKIWSEWLPSCKAYKLAANYDIEAYYSNDEYSEIWLPIERV